MTDVLELGIVKEMTVRWPDVGLVKLFGKVLGEQVQAPFISQGLQILDWMATAVFSVLVAIVAILMDRSVFDLSAHCFNLKFFLGKIKSLRFESLNQVLKALLIRLGINKRRVFLISRSVEKKPRRARDAKLSNYKDGTR